MTVYSEVTESSSETDNEQTQDSTHSAIFSSDKPNYLQPAADDAQNENDKELLSAQTESAALPAPAWLDASSQDSNAADARAKEIRDMIRVSLLSSHTFL